MGGLARRATVLEKLRREADGVVVVQGADDLCGPQVLQPQRKRRGQLILDAYARMGVDAEGLGERDREAGVDLRRVKGEALVTRAGIRVGIFSADLEIPGAEPSLASDVARLRAKGARLVVALLHAGMTKARAALEKESPDIDVAVVSHDPGWMQAPQLVGRTWVVQPQGQGKQLGALDLHVVDHRLTFVGASGRSSIEVAIADTERALADVAKRFPADGPLKDFGLKRQRELQRQLAAYRAQLQTAFAKDGAIVGSWLENRILPLGADVADAPAIASLVKKYKDDVARLAPPPASPPGAHPGTMVAAPSTFPMTAAAAAPASAMPTGYAGGESCRKCHRGAVAVWLKSKHARAWQALQKNAQYKDPACVVCHVTGGSSLLHDVQCEACHGPSAAHVAQPKVAGLTLRNPPEDRCTLCHRKPQAQEWEYASFRAATLGPGHGRR